MNDKNYITDTTNQFKNKIIVITGSTQGIGEETAKLFASRGAKGITICGRNEKKGLKVKEEIERIGTECVFVQADLSEIDDCKKIISSTDDIFGTINTLISCAGFTERGTILSTTLDNYEKNFNINARAPFFLMQDAIKIMRRDEQKGTIACIITMAAHSGMPIVLLKERLLL